MTHDCHCLYNVCFAVKAFIMALVVLYTDREARRGTELLQQAGNTQTTGTLVTPQLQQTQTLDPHGATILGVPMGNLNIQQQEMTVQHLQRTGFLHNQDGHQLATAGGQRIGHGVPAGGNQNHRQISTPGITPSPNPTGPLGAMTGQSQRPTGPLQTGPIGVAHVQSQVAVSPYDDVPTYSMTHNPKGM